MLNSSPTIQLSQLRFSYSGEHRNTLEIEHLSLGAAEQIGIIGSTGAGKSTLLKLIDGRLSGWTGQVEILRHSLSPQKTLPRHLKPDIGFVFQEFALIERSTVFENVCNGRLGRTHPTKSLLGKFSKEDIAIVLAAIRDVDLEDYTHKRVDQLSGGQRQRVAVARCLSQEPKIILADEPVSNLDPLSADKMLELLGNSARKRSATLVLSSHQPERVSKYVGRIIGLKQGEIVFDKRVDDITAQDFMDIYGKEMKQSAA